MNLYRKHVCLHDKTHKKNFHPLCLNFLQCMSWYRTFNLSHCFHSMLCVLQSLLHAQGVCVTRAYFSYIHTHQLDISVLRFCTAQQRQLLILSDIFIPKLAAMHSNVEHILYKRKAHTGKSASRIKHTQTTMKLICILYIQLKCTYYINLVERELYFPLLRN